MDALFVIVPIFVILVSLLSIVSPKLTWYLQEGWKYKNLEPSAAVLMAIRVGGVFGVIFAVVFMMFARNLLQNRFGN